MMVIIDNLAPVFFLIALGHVLGRINFISKSFFQQADRLVYFIFFPVMLFSKIGRADVGDDINWTLTGALLVILTIAWILSLLYAKLTKMPDSYVGSFSQCSFRFNTYMALAVVLNAVGEDGVRMLGIMISIIIPYLNSLTVCTLIWYSQSSYSLGEKVKVFSKAMIGNPLIIGCALGIIYSLFDTPFPSFFDNTFRLLSVSALPLALLSVGATLTVGIVKGFLKESLGSCAIKLVFLPLAGYFVLTWLGFSGPQFKVALLFLAMPTSATVGIFSSQLGSDVNMASAGVVLSTVFSFFSLAAVMLI